MSGRNWFQSRSADWAADINTALADASAIGGLTVWLPPDGVSGGITLDSQIVVPSNVTLRGEGRDYTTISPGAIGGSIQMIKTTSYDASAGDGEVGFGLEGFRLDGGEAAFGGIGIWGHRFLLRDLMVRGCQGGQGLDVGNIGGEVADNALSQSSYERLIFQNNGTAAIPQIECAGPKDSHWNDIIISAHNIAFKVPQGMRLHGNAFSQKIHQMHIWGRGHSEGLLVDDTATQCQFTACLIEGADTNQIRCSANGLSMSSCVVFGIPGAAPAGTPLAIGIQMRQNGGGAEPSGAQVHCRIINTPIAGIDFFGPCVGGISRYNLVTFGTGGVTGGPVASNNILFI